MAKKEDKPVVVEEFVPVKVMDPRSGSRKRINSQAELEKHLAHGWIVWAN